MPVDMFGNYYEDIFSIDSCQYIYDDKTDPKLPDPKKWKLGETIRGFREVTQLSTSYKKWVKVIDINADGIETAFYDADWQFNPYSDPDSDMPF